MTLDEHVRRMRRCKCGRLHDAAPSPTFCCRRCRSGCRYRSGSVSRLLLCRRLWHLRSPSNHAIRPLSVRSHSAPYDPFDRVQLAQLSCRFPRFGVGRYGALLVGVRFGGRSRFGHPQWWRWRGRGRAVEREPALVVFREAEQLSFVRCEPGSDLNAGNGQHTRGRGAELRLTGSMTVSRSPVPQSANMRAHTPTPAARHTSSEGSS